ncbi:hypothetical protein [Pseudomonas sp. OV226]|uniref:hypothetical protein n=1 Tax=Pseudomonas sp. OV226 TaxID=2135588 RepID=UPI000D6D5B6C|nr:hypothetical protein [Pseudomonas sp. OV226]PWK30244.1 hypothetical protein C7534_12928 [Pseudomonas sp. OV226]
MTIDLKTLKCAECASTALDQSGLNEYTCRHCRSVTRVEDDGADHLERVLNQVKYAAAERLASEQASRGRTALRIVGILGGGMAIVFLLLVTLVSPGKQDGRPSFGASSLEQDRLEASTVYQRGDGKFAFVRVLDSGNGEVNLYRVVITDLDSGTPLAEPQRFELPGTPGARPEFQHFSNGEIYLTLNGRRLSHLDSASARFDDLNKELINRHPEQFSIGVSAIDSVYNSPDAFKVTTNGGSVYNVHWLTGEVVADAKSYSDYIDQPFESYTNTQRRIDFASVPGASLLRPSVLVSYDQKVRTGKYQQWPNLSLPGPGDYLRSKDYHALTKEYGFSPYSFRGEGITNFEVVSPGETRFEASVLARNDARVLVAYDPTPVEDQGRVLQLLDAKNGKVIWSRTVDQLPQITRHGRFVKASPLASGFYIDSNTPSLLIDNDGNILHDFRHLK